MEWGCYAWAGGVEESEFCLFLVVFPAKCFSSVSLRVYFRKHDFCFLPVVAILESPLSCISLAPLSLIFKKIYILVQTMSDFFLLERSEI
jgi:hypothetical protein